MLDWPAAIQTSPISTSSSRRRSAPALTCRRCGPPAFSGASAPASGRHGRPWRRRCCGRPPHAHALPRFGLAPDAQRRTALQHHVVGKHAGEFHGLADRRRRGRSEQQCTHEGYQVKVTTPLAGSS
jgi:hypothetical protein